MSKINKYTVWEPLAESENVNHFNKIREIKDQNF